MKNSITIVEHAEFPRSQGTDADEMARLVTLRKCRKRQRKILSRLRRKDAGSDVTANKNMIRELEGSSAYRICAAVMANKRLPFARRVSLAEVFEIGRNSSWNKVPDEVVPVHIKPKRGDECRTICDFKHRYRTMHYAAEPTVFPNLKPKPFQYEFKGKGEFGGIASAILDIKAILLAGNTWGARLDIVKCYENVVEQPLCKMLPHQKNVVRLFAVGNHMNVVVNDGPYNAYYDLHDAIDQARRGAPQGSALSAKIVSSIISHLNWNAIPFLFNWVDDFFILGLTEEAVTEAANTLIAKVSALPGGHFSLKLKEIGHMGDGMVFLGHRVTLSNGEVEIEPAFLDDFLGPLEEMDERLGPLVYMLNKTVTPSAKLKAFKVIGDTWVFAKSWASAFKACDVMPELLGYVAQEIQQHCKMAGISWEDIEAYRNVDARWKRRYS